MSLGRRLHTVPFYAKGKAGNLDTYFYSFWLTPSENDSSPALQHNCSTTKLWLGMAKRTQISNQILIIFAVLRQSVYRVLRSPSPRHCTYGQLSYFRKNVAAVASCWQLYVRFDRPEIWTSDLPLQGRTHYAWLIRRSLANQTRRHGGAFRGRGPPNDCLSPLKQNLCPPKRGLCPEKINRNCCYPPVFS